MEFISGDPTRREDLLRAGIMHADTAIVLTDPQSTQNIPSDAQSVLITLAIETLRRDVYTCVQFLDSKYCEHLERANVDEYFPLQNLGANLVAASALNHGLSRMVNNLLTFNEGSEIYRIPLPNSLEGFSFNNAAKLFLDKDMILIGLETARASLARELEEKLNLQKMVNEDRAWLINPPKDHLLRKGDYLFVIADEQPSLNSQIA